MSQKKTIVLSPLPEQTDDYSRYEETVTRWDRIIAAAVIVVLLISGSIYFLTSESHNEVEIAAPINVISEEKAPSVEPEKEEAVVAQIPQAVETNLAEDISVQTANRLDAKINQDSKPLLADKLPKEERQISAATEPEPHTDNMPKAASAETSEAAERSGVKVLNNGISKAVLTLEIKDGRPGSSIPQSLMMPQEGIMKVILFTDMQGLKGKKLFHDWYLDGIRQARVKIPVNLNDQSSHSSKYINAQMTGEWLVKVVDEKSEVYALADFEVVLP